MAETKPVIERHVEAFNGRRADAEPGTEDAEFVAPGASMRGQEEVLAFLGAFWEAFPDRRLELSRVFGEGSVAAAEGRFVGTHSGVFRTPAGEVPGHRSARRLPLDVRLRGSRRQARLRASVLRSSGAPHPARPHVVPFPAVDRTTRSRRRRRARPCLALLRSTVRSGAAAGSDAVT
jgi:SnoaL-like domain